MENNDNRCVGQFVGVGNFAATLKYNNNIKFSVIEIVLEPTLHYAHLVGFD